jgi:hypothetical protein
MLQNSPGTSFHFSPSASGRWFFNRRKLAVTFRFGLLEQKFYSRPTCHLVRAAHVLIAVEIEAASVFARGTVLADISLPADLLLVASGCRRRHSVWSSAVLMPVIATADRTPVQQRSEEEAFVRGQALAGLLAPWHIA